MLPEIAAPVRNARAWCGITLVSRACLGLIASIIHVKQFPDSPIKVGTGSAQVSGELAGGVTPA